MEHCSNRVIEPETCEKDIDRVGRSGVRCRATGGPRPEKRENRKRKRAKKERKERRRSGSGAWHCRISIGCRQMLRWSQLLHLRHSALFCFSSRFFERAKQVHTPTNATLVHDVHWWYYCESLFSIYHLQNFIEIALIERPLKTLHSHIDAIVLSIDRSNMAVKFKFHSARFLIEFQTIF